MRWYFDTSVFVAAAVDTHPHHLPAIQVLKELVDQKHEGFVSGHSLAEAYAVLTRTPFPKRLSADQVMRAIEALILASSQLVTLTGSEYEEVVRHCAANQWTGGRVFDAIHLRCALKIQCDRIYTFNLRDFVAMAPAALSQAILSP